ncbi:MAG: P-type conjugative transfer protein TrbL [Alphaproteobacteria bacterium]
MGGTSVIDRFLEVFTRYIDSGFGLLGGEVAFLTSTLIAIDIVLAGLVWAWGADEDVVARLVRKTLYIGFFAFVIGNFNRLARIVFESFAGLGLQAGGSAISEAELLQPGRLAQVGFDAGRPILIAAAQLMGFTSFFENFIQIAILMLAWLIVLVAFFILAVQLFITLIEFKLTTLAGFVLIPFALFGKTAFLAERVLGNVVASGVKILVLAVIVGIGSGLFGEFSTGFGGAQPTIEEALSVVLGAVALCGLGIFAPGIASGLVAGAPQLGAGAAVGTTLAVGGLGAAGVIGARAGAGALGGAIGGAARGGAYAAGGAATTYRLAAASSGQTGLAATAAGLGGVARASAGAAIQPARSAAARTAGALAESFQAGGQGAFAVTGGSRPDSTAAAPLVAGAAPAWAQRLRRSQALSHGVAATAHAVRSGDHGGGAMSIPLDQDDRR